VEIKSIFPNRGEGKGNKMALENDKPIANPLIVLREEFDDWAILFDPDSGKGYGLDPVSVFIWKRLDGQHTIKDIMADLDENCEDMPEDAEDRVGEFIQELMAQGLAGSEVKKE
jgi:SynChlorMet cassette protein ScmD